MAIDGNTNYRDFKGIWIPREIWLNEKLLPLEKMMWAEIHSLHSRERMGCFASREYLSHFFGVTDRYVRKMLEKLKKFDLVEDVSFDGRTKVIRAKLPKETFGDEFRTDRNYSSGQGGPAVPVTPEPQFRSTTKNIPYIDNKDYNKVDKEIHAPLSSDAFSCSNFSNKKIERAQDVATTEAEHRKLLAKYGEELTAECYEELASWKKSAAPSQVKKHSSDYRRITKWVALELLEGKSKEIKLLKPAPTQQGSSSAETNRQWAKETFATADRNKIKCWQDFIEIQVQGRKVTIFYHEHGFQEQVRNAMEKADLQPLKNLKTAGAL